MAAQPDDVDGLLASLGLLPAATPPLLAEEMLPAAGAAEPVVAGVAEPAPAVSASDASDTEVRLGRALAGSSM